MNRPFLPPFYVLIVIAMACLNAPAPVSLIAESILILILAGTATATAVAALYAMVCPQLLTTIDRVHLSESIYIDHAVISFALLATGWDKLGIAWMLVAVVRAGVIYWADDNQIFTKK